MALPETTDFVLNNDWTLIVAGAVDDLHIEVNGQTIYYRLEGAVPTSSHGHKLDEDTHGRNIRLDAGVNLYARSKGTQSILVATGE